MGLEITPSLVQLTGQHLLSNQVRHAIGELADPSPPHVLADGTIRIYGSGSYAIEFPDWAAFLGGGSGTRTPLTICDLDGVPYRGPHRAWDINVRRWPDGAEVLYAGVMTPVAPKRRAQWPRDNWTRRVYAFHPKGGAHRRWVREAQPLFGEVAASGWLGHCYGHHFLDLPDGTTYVFYERVSQESTGAEGHAFPHRTEIFARRMKTPTRAHDEEICVLDVGEPPFAATHRFHAHSHQPWGYLVEGPRPVRIENNGRALYLMGFSAGDFPTDRYGIHFAWSDQPLGPYSPLLSETNADFQDFGRPIREQLALSWGPARPALFSDPAGRWWVLFHAVRKEILPDRDYSRWPTRGMHHFFRCLFLASLEIEFGTSGPPRIAIRASGVGDL